MNNDLINRKEAIDALESAIDYFDDYVETRELVKAQQLILRALPSASKSYILQKLEKQRQERKGE